MSTGHSCVSGALFKNIGRHGIEFSLAGRADHQRQERGLLQDIQIQAEKRDDAFGRLLDFAPAAGINQGLHILFDSGDVGKIPGGSLEDGFDFLAECYDTGEVSHRSKIMRKSSVLIVVCLTCLCFSQAAAPAKRSGAPDLQDVLSRIRAASLRGDLAFLSSDLLEGRNTPSRGLDIAAEYIAAQFRRAGLEPGGDDGYYQTAHMAVSEPNWDGFELKLSRGDASFTGDPKDVVLNANAALEISGAPVFKLDLSDAAQVKDLAAEQLEGKVILTESGRGSMANFRAAGEKLRLAKPAAIVTIARKGAGAHDQPERRLVDPEASGSGTPRILIAGPDAVRFYAALKPGPSDAQATIRVAAPRRTPVALRNVIGILRGSDPALNDTAVLLTAHYDHIGRLPDGPGDRIYNGANDDGSGTVSVMEVARALASLPQHPRRSMVFMTFFGEEEGMVGSRYYARHPAWPIAKTVAQLNLEQVGRTDSSEGPHVADATLTGFDYSNLSDYLAKAGELTGVKLYKHPQNSDPYFRLSDNISLAEAGVPAHTLAVSFEYPDYHGLGDEWQKIDYDNMAKVDRMVAAALMSIADSEEPVHWSEKNSKAAPFVKASKERHP